MKAVKTIQRYQCDFCKYRSVKHICERHEKRCFRNPNRFCDRCQNTGKYMQEIDTPYETVSEVEMNCPYCSKFNPETLKEIEKWESEQL